MHLVSMPCGTPSGAPTSHLLSAATAGWRLGGGTLGRAPEIGWRLGAGPAGARGLELSGYGRAFTALKA